MPPPFTPTHAYLRRKITVEEWIKIKNATLKVKIKKSTQRRNDRENDAPGSYVLSDTTFTNLPQEQKKST